MIQLQFEPEVDSDERKRIAAILDACRAPIDRNLLVAPLPGGASNANYLLTAPSGNRYVVRVARSDVSRFGIDRWRGAAAQRAVAQLGLAPTLLGASLPAGHAISQYVSGDVLDTEKVRRPGMLRRVARCLRSIHCGPTIDGTFSIFDDQRLYTRTALEEGLSLPSDFTRFCTTADSIELAFSRCSTPSRLCHNDLQLQNIVAVGERLVVLDWEYAGMGNPYFDLGGLTINAQLNIDERHEFLTAYFGSSGDTHSARLELMLFMSALREATWAVIAEPVLDLDWDYKAWAQEYFDRCRKSLEGGLAIALEAAVAA